MINFAEKLTFWNIANLFFGAVFAFFLMVMLSCALFSKILSKYNKNHQIREISKKAYVDFYQKKNNMKDKIISSLIYEIKEISQQSFPDKKYPLYELSINEILGGILIVQRKLKRFIDHPLCKDIKNVHIATLLSFEENVAQPIMNFYNHKTFQLLYRSYKMAKSAFNIVNPIFYMKKILYLTVFKKGKKDIIIICLDFVGNCCYEIYNNEKNLQKI